MVELNFLEEFSNYECQSLDRTNQNENELL